MRTTGKREMTKATEKISCARPLMGLMLTKGGFARFGYLVG